MPRDDRECANIVQRLLFMPGIGGDDGLGIDSASHGIADRAVTVERKRLRISGHVRVAWANTRARMGDGALLPGAE